MNANWKEARKLLNLVTSAIDCILRNRYDGYSRKPFYVELGTEVGPGASRTAEEVERMSEKFFRMPEHYPPETGAAFLALKKEQTRERLAEFLEQFVDVPVEADLALLELKEASWEEILIWIDSYIAQRPYLERKVGELVVKQREGLSNPGARELERSAEMSSPNVLSLYVVRKYAAEFKELFPHMVERAGDLQLIPAGKGVPDYIRHYLEEASRCFIYGHFLASLLVCRSAIEAAAKDRLRGNRFARELSEVEDSLVGILNLALEKGLIDKIIWLAADDIRKTANKAAHPEAVPDEGRCKSAFDATRGILQHLYE